MKKVIIAFVAVIFLACNSTGSTEEKLDSLRERVDTTTDKIIDSAKAKAERFVDTVKQRLNKKDSKADSTKNSF